MDQILEGDLLRRLIRAADKDSYVAGVAVKTCVEAGGGVVVDGLLEPAFEVARVLGCLALDGSGNTDGGAVRVMGVDGLKDFDVGASLETVVLKNAAGDEAGIAEEAGYAALEADAFFTGGFRAARAGGLILHWSVRMSTTEER